MKKAIFLDLDGTVLDDDYNISEINKRAVKQKIKEGYNIYIITGKSFNGSIDFYKELGLNNSLVCYSGQAFYNPNNEGGYDLEIISIDVNDAMSIVDEISSLLKVVNYMFAGLNNKYYSHKKINSNMIDLLDSKDRIQDFEDSQGECNTVIGSYVEVENKDSAELLKITKSLNEKHKGKYDFAFWMTDGNLPIIQFKPIEAGKSFAMQKIIERDNIDYSISFGNGWSDRLMLQQSNEGYAMKNASDKVKSFTKYSTEFDNNNSGVGRQLEKIGE